MQNSVGRYKPVIVIGILLLSVPIILVISLAIGRYSVSPAQVLDLLLERIFHAAKGQSEMLHTVVFNIRLPRILASVLIGMALATSGAVYQGLFRNPMVSPDILGASAGAGFGAALAILMSLGHWGIYSLAFAFGLFAVAATYLISSSVSRNNSVVLVLVLAGIVVSTLFTAFTSITKYIADPDNKLPVITFWLMGGLSTIEAKSVYLLCIPLFVGMLPLFSMRWYLNVLSFGEEEARAMGIDTGLFRLLFITCSTLLTAAAVSVSGMIGWIGLIVPHMGRLIVGPDYRVLLPVSALIGGIFLAVVDDIARSAIAAEIPLGILTAIIGAPFFIGLLLKGRKSWV